MKKIGVIGCGIMGNLHAEAISKHPEVELRAVCDIDRQKAEDVKNKTDADLIFTDYSELLSDPEINAVHIALPDHLHKEVTVLALRNGKDVLLEKPMTTNVEEADCIYDTVSQTGRLFMVNFSNRWMLAFRKMKKIIQEGRIGSVRHFFGMLSNTTYVPHNMLSWSGSSSPTFFLLPHVTDIARWLIQDDVESVFALNTEGVLKEQDIDTHDTMAAALRFSNGVSAHLETAWILPESLPGNIHSYYRIIGSRGMIIWDRHHNRLQVYENDKIIYDKPYSEPDPGFFGLSVRHFISCLNGKEDPIGGVEDGLKNTQILCAIKKSSETGEVITP